MENRRVVAIFVVDAEGKKKAEAEAKLFGGEAVLMTVPEDEKGRPRKASL